MKYERFIMKPIPFRRRLKQLIKSFQQCNGDYHKLLNVSEIFEQQFGFRFKYIGCIKHVLKTKYSGSALARVGRAALKNNCHIDPWNISYDNLHQINFHKVRTEVLMFSREDKIQIKVLPDGTEKEWFTMRGEYKKVEN